MNNKGFFLMSATMGSVIVVITMFAMISLLVMAHKRSNQLQRDMRALEVLWGNFENPSVAKLCEATDECQGHTPKLCIYPFLSLPYAVIKRCDAPPGCNWDGTTWRYGTSACSTGVIFN